MRNNPIYKNGTISARNAMIFWDTKTKRVEVVEFGKQIPDDVAQFPYSGGACFARWQIVCADRPVAMLVCMRQFWELVFLYDLPPDIVDSALSNIIEYQSAFILNVDDSGFEKTNHF